MAENEPAQPGNAPLQPAVRVAPLAELRVYQITEDELTALERGTPASLYLNLALPLLSAGVTFLVALLSSAVSTRVFIVFVVLCVVTSLAGAILLIVWARNHQSTRSVARQIRQRMPPAPGMREV